MINPQQFYETLSEQNLTFFTGVPDSLLKSFCAYVAENSKDNHIIAANEGNAIAIASGYHLATGKIGVVYMQNSGLGNCANPLTSLTDPAVYSIPILMIIGWRGEPGNKDEPHHLKPGEITLELLDTLGISYSILPDNLEEAKATITKAVNYMNSNKAPHALVIRKDTFEQYPLRKRENNFTLDRESALKVVESVLDGNEIIVSTTGKLSRELFELRAAKNQGHQRDFLTVGSMGHSSSIALGIALQIEKEVFCFDGDGAAIMHLGALSTIGHSQPKNFKHIIFNNYSHESVGGQPTSADNINFPNAAIANGYAAAYSASTEDEIKEKVRDLKSCKGPVLLEIKVNTGSRKDLGRPTSTPSENKEKFMQFVNE